MTPRVGGRAYSRVTFLGKLFIGHQGYLEPAGLTGTNPRSKFIGKCYSKLIRKMKKYLESPHNLVKLKWRT